MADYFWNVDQMAEVLCKKRKAVLEAVKQGKLPYYKVGRQIRFDPETIKALMAAQWSVTPPHS